MSGKPVYGITAQQIRDKYDAMMSFPTGPQRDLILIAVVGDLILWIEDREKLDKLRSALARKPLHCTCGRPLQANKSVKCSGCNKYWEQCRCPPLV